MRYVFLALALVLGVGPAQAIPTLISAVPSPEMDLGIGGLAMVAAAAYLAHRRMRG